MFLLNLIKWVSGAVRHNSEWWEGCPFLLLGGDKTTIQQAPPQPPAPSAGESAEDLFKARLQYDPQIAQLEQSLAEQYLPQQASLQAALYQQYAPLMAGTQEQLRQQFSPEQYALTQAFGQQAMQRLQDPYGQTPEETAALEAIRGRQRQQLTEGLRTRANLGGGLFGGRAQATEQRGLTELEQAFAAEDIGRRQQGAETALRYSMPVIQQLYPQTQYPGAAPQQAPVGQAVTPSGDALYNALYGAGRPTYFQDRGDSGGVRLGILGTWGGSTSR